MRTPPPSAKPPRAGCWTPPPRSRRMRWISSTGSPVQFRRPRPGGAQPRPAAARRRPLHPAVQPRAARPAPGLAVFGAEVPLDLLAAGPGLPLAAASGTGVTLLDALRAASGRGSNCCPRSRPRRSRASRIRTAPHPGQIRGTRRRPAAARHGAGWLGSGLAFEWTPAPPGCRPGSACAARPRAGIRTTWPLSVGCAAGPTPEAAALHALLELVERDAAALWWRGSRRAGRWRSRTRRRRRPSRCSTPCAGARPGGEAGCSTSPAEPRCAGHRRALDRGGWPRLLLQAFAARTGRAAAARAAVLEMTQMEMAHAVVLAKRAEAGEAALNARDRAHLRAFHGIDASGCALLHPHGAAATGPGIPAGPGEAMAALVGRLGARGLPVLTLISRALAWAFRSSAWFARA